MTNKLYMGFTKLLASKKYQMNTDHKFSFAALIVSILALGVSLLSYLNSEKTLKIDEARFSMLNTPTIVDKVDSTYVNFSLDKGFLQRIGIFFPREVMTKPKYLLSKPFKLHKYSLERMAQEIIENHHILSDSTIAFGHIIIPVIIAYSSNHLSYEHTLREHRHLEFSFTHSRKGTNSRIETEFLTSSLIQRISFPIKRQFHWKIPYTEVDEDKIFKRDSVDLYDFLDNKFEFLLEQFKVVK